MGVSWKAEWSEFGLSESGGLLGFLLGEETSERESIGDLFRSERWIWTGKDVGFGIF